MSKLTLQQLDTGIEAAVANAASLIEEAELLFRSNFHARAYTLAHIAREELAKVTMFYAAGLRMLAGKAVDWKKLHKRLRDHNSKLTRMRYCRLFPLLVRPTHFPWKKCLEAQRLETNGRTTVSMFR